MNFIYRKLINLFWPKHYGLWYGTWKVSERPEVDVRGIEGKTGCIVFIELND